MKTIFALLFCGFALSLTSCKKKTETSDGWLKSPASVVSGTSVTISCNTDFAENILNSYEAGFAYAPASGDSGYKFVTGATIKGSMLSYRLTGLNPETEYVYYAFVNIQNERFTSTTASFKTGVGSDTPDPDPDPDPTPDPTPGHLSGWAELPVSIDKPGDYYFAYHLCPDVYVPGTNNKQKRRNYAVCYSNSLKCAIWVSAPMHDCYAVKNTDRTNAYKADPSISVSQPDKWDGYTRGHMLGSGERLVSRATNEQVFYHSNIAPQFGQPYFNTGGGTWNVLEGWVDTQWANQSDTTYQVIGTYWKNKNKVVSGTTIPTHYYKILLRTKGHKNKWVVNCTRDELQCIAVMVEHRTYDKSEVPQPKDYKSKGLLYSVEQIEQMTGQKFFVNVPNAPKDTYNVADWGL